MSGSDKMEVDGGPPPLVFDDEDAQGQDAKTPDSEEKKKLQRLNGFEQLPGARVAPLVPGVGAVRSCAAAGTLCTPEHFCTPSSQTKEVRHTGTTPPPLRGP